MNIKEFPGMNFATSYLVDSKLKPIFKQGHKSIVIYEVENKGEKETHFDTFDANIVQANSDLYKALIDANETIKIQAAEIAALKPAAEKYYISLRKKN